MNHPTRQHKIAGVFLVALALLASTCYVSAQTYKSGLDGQSVTLSGFIVSAVFADDAALYVQSPDRSSGIRVISSAGTLEVGDTLNVTGTLGTRRISGYAAERQITSPSITVLASGLSPKPLGMNCFTIGGETIGAIPGVSGGIGLGNIGLLVEYTGKINLILGSYMWIDDGCGCPDADTGGTGVVVRCPTGVNPAVVGNIVKVIGVVEGNIPTGWTASRRYIHMRTWSDISFPAALPTGPGSIAGTAKDAAGLQIPGVIISTGAVSNTTTINGAYNLPSLVAGSYSLTATIPGYAVQSMANVLVQSLQATTANFTLTQAGQEAPINGYFERGFTGGVGNGWSSWKSLWSNNLTFTQESQNQMSGNYAQTWGRSDSLTCGGGVATSLPTTIGQTYEINAWLRMNTAASGAWLEAGVDLSGQTTNGDAASVTYTKLETKGNRKWIRYQKLVKATGQTVSFFTKLGQSSQSAGPNWATVDAVTIQPRTVLEAEDYTSAYDTTSGNAWAVYRTGDVDIHATPDNAGYVVGLTAKNEWLAWSNVFSTGTDHAMVIEYSAYQDSAVRVSIDSVNVTGSVSLPKSGGWDSYRRVVVPGVFWMGAGNHTVRLTFETAVCNIDRISLVPVSSGPFLEAEDYTTYLDTTTGNTGGKYRTDSVDIDSGADGCYVGWTAAGEWLEYPVHGDSRAYVAVLRYAGTSQAKINLTLNGNNVTGDVLLPSTGNWQTWRSIVTPAFTLPAGASALRLNILTAGFNLNYITLAPIGDGGAGSDLLTGLHFAGGAADFNDVASGRGVGNWLYSTEVYANGNREPNDASFQTNMTDLIVNYLKPMVQNRIHPILRIDYVWGETIPRLLTNNVVDDAAVSKYVRTFTKFAQLADANGVPIRQFVVANEMNLKNEATGFTNASIPEWYYAYVYDQIRTALSALGPGYELLVGAVSPGTLTPDPIYTPPDATTFYQTWSTDGFAYLDNICQELKRKGTQNIGFALHGYANFDSNDGYTSDAMWAVRKQLEVIEKSHTVTPYGQTTAVSMGGFVTAPVYITEWNRHTPQTSSDGPVFQETQTSTFISTFVTQISRFNRNREVWDNVSKVWRTYDPRDVQHNYHPIKGLCYFVFDTLGGAWGDYSLKTWHTLAGSATGSNDMYTTYQTQIGLRDPAGR